MKRNDTIRDGSSTNGTGGLAMPHLEPLEPRVLLSASPYAALAAESRGLVAYEAPAPERGETRDVDYNLDGVINAADWAARPGHDTPGESTLRIGGAYSNDAVPGNTALSGVVVAGYGESGATVSLGSGAFLNLNDSNPWSGGYVGQSELDGVLLNWGSTAAPNFGGTTIYTPRTTDLLAQGLIFQGSNDSPSGSRILARQAPKGETTQRGASQFSENSIDIDHSTAIQTGLNLGEVGFESPDIEVTQGTFMPLGLSVDANQGYELVAEYDNAWGDPFAQGVGAAITSSGELALISAGGYVGGFDLAVTDLNTNSTQTRHILIVPRGHGVVPQAALPNTATPNADGVWQYQLPTTDGRGEPLKYDVSFLAPNPGGFRWDAVALVDDDGLLTVDMQTIEEMWRDRAADSNPGPIAFDGLHMQSMPFTLQIAASDGWTSTSWTHRMSFTPADSGTAPNVGLDATLRDVVIDADDDTHSFFVPAYDREGDAIDFDVWLSTGEAAIEPFAVGTQHRVTITSPYLGVQNLRVRLQLSDGGNPVGHSFVLRAKPGAPDGPYVEQADIRRDAADGSIITVPLPVFDRSGQKFTYDARIVPVDAAGRLMFDWQERTRTGGSSVGYPGYTLANPHLDGIDGDNHGPDGLFQDVYSAFDIDWSAIESMARVVTRGDRLGIITDPSFVGSFAVVLRGRLSGASSASQAVEFYDAFRVTIDRASTPRSLDSLIGVTRNVTKPAERRGFFKQLPRTDDRGRTISYKATSTARDWVDIGYNKAGQFGMNVVPKQGFGGAFGITLTAAVGGERVTRNIDYTVQYADDWSPVRDARDTQPSTLATLGGWYEFWDLQSYSKYDDDEAYRVASNGLLRADALRHDSVLNGDTGVLSSLPATATLNGTPTWQVALPGTDTDGTPLIYHVATSAGRWARVDHVKTGAVLIVSPPGNFTGRFLVEVVATRPGAILAYGDDYDVVASPQVYVDEGWVGHRVFEVVAR